MQQVGALTRRGFPHRRARLALHIRALRRRVPLAVREGQAALLVRARHGTHAAHPRHAVPCTAALPAYRWCRRRRAAAKPHGVAARPAVGRGSATLLRLPRVVCRAAGVAVGGPGTLACDLRVRRPRGGGAAGRVGRVAQWVRTPACDARAAARQADRQDANVRRSRARAEVCGATTF
eukprot:48710-Chlamydomonas_euryale.AAC.1